MKIVALDLGDKWVGSAISDGLGILAKPYRTITLTALDSLIQELIHKEKIVHIVIGYPKTLRGTESEQTKLVVLKKQELEQKFPQITWVLWDERLTSKKAEQLKRIKTQEDKLQSHSVAAAFILQSYLDYLHQQKLNVSQNI